MPGIAEILETKRVPAMVACSPIFITGGRVPADYPDYVHVTGFVFVPDAAESAVDPRLKEFLADGDPCVMLAMLPLVIATMYDGGARACDQRNVPMKVAHVCL